MKFNFKKVAAVTASMLVGTFAITSVAAMDYPDNWSSSSVAVVYGNNVDSAVATNINEDIEDSISFESGGSSASVGEESALISSTGNDLTFGEALDNVEDNLDDRDLTELLAEGTLKDDSVDYDEEEEVDYFQDIYTSDDSVTFDSLDDDDYVVNTDLADDEEPVLHIQQSNEAYNVTVDFATAINASAYDDSESITVLGKELTFDQEMSAGDTELVLYESTETFSLDMDESKTVDGDEVELTGGSKGTANLKINGELVTLDEGESDKGYYANKVVYSDIGDGSISVELFAGAEEWSIDKIDAWTDVAIENTDIDGVQAKINSDSDDVDEIQDITFSIIPTDMDEDEKEYLEIGEALEDPLFDLSMVFDSVNPELKSDDKGKIELSASDTASIDFTSRNGKDYSISPFEMNNDGDDIVLGEDWYSLDNSTNYTDLEEDHIFIASEGTQGSDSEETLVYQVDNVEDDDGDSPYVEFADLSSGSVTKVYSGKQLGDTGLYVSDIAADETKFWLQNSDASENATVQNQIVTENNMRMTLVLDGTDSEIYMDEDADEVFNLDEDFRSNITVDMEIDSDDDEIELKPSEGADFTARSNSDTDTDYAVSKLGTYYEADNDVENSMDIWTPSEGQTVYDVYFSGSAESDDSSSEAGSKVLTDDEAYADNDVVIAVGGSCINSAAAEALGVSEKTCGPDFTDATGVGSGEFLIQKVSDAYDGEATAIVVAGYEADDTEAAGNTFIDEDVELSEDGQVYSTATKEVVTAE